MQFAILASFAALAVAVPYNSPPSYGNGGDAAASSSAIATATTAAHAPGVTPISGGNGNSGSGSGNNGSGSGNGNGNGNGSGSGDLCPALWTPQCCQADVLGLLGLTCDAPSLGLASQQSFVNDCAATGSTAQCCILPVAGQAVICTDV